MKKSLLTSGAFMALGLLLGLLFTAIFGVWDAPKMSRKIKNPMAEFKNNELMNSIGKTEYTMQCSPCHGKFGVGDGAAGRFLEKSPTNLTTKEFQSQTDGEIFWKINTGKSPMPSFEEIISEKKIWIVVNYLRTLKKN